MLHRRAAPEPVIPIVQAAVEGAPRHFTQQTRDGGLHARVRDELKQLNQGRGIRLAPWAAQALQCSCAGAVVTAKQLIESEERGERIRATRQRRPLRAQTCAGRGQRRQSCQYIAAIHAVSNP